MHGRHLLENGQYIYIPIGSICAIAFAIFFGCCKWCSERVEAGEAARRAESAPREDIEAPPIMIYPQFASSNSSNPGVIDVPVDWSNYSPERNPFTRAQIEAMSVDELKTLKEKLDMGNLAPVPKNEFVDMALAVQTSLMQQASIATASEWGRTSSISARNPTTGLMECGVCMSPMGGNAERSMAAATCGHVYCYDCLNQCDKCPTCRQGYSKSQIIKVYSS